MQVNERDRHELYEWARAAMGERQADTFMAYLPPVGWGDVATRRDLDVLRAEVHAEIAGLSAEMDVLRAELRAEMADGFRRLTNVLVSVIVGVGGFVTAVVVAAAAFT